MIDNQGMIDNPELGLLASICHLAEKGKDKKVQEFLENCPPEVFENELNRETFVILKEFYSNPQYEVITGADVWDKLVKRFGKRQDLDLYVFSLYDYSYTPTGKAWRNFANLLLDRFKGERLKEVAKTMYEKAEKRDFESLRDYVEREFHKIFGTDQQEEIEDSKECLNATLDELEKNERRFLSGYPSLDEITGGFKPGELITVAGRPGMGKTALLLNTAFNLAVENNVIFLSLEMSKKELILRLLSMNSGVPLWRLRERSITEKEWHKILEASSVIGERKMAFSDGLVEVERIERLIKYREVDVIFIDYLQLMQTEKKVENRVAEVSKLSRDLKMLAGEFNIPIIVASQLNRSVESRADRRPTLADLRDSGAIEQDSDLVLLLYREDYYQRKKDKPKQVEVEIEIAKNRNGKTGIAKLMLNLEILRFEG